ncbi:L-xylulose/3-keto-L-gulonate kinase [Sedimentisphaera cyanobacteriorum]|uniref:L-xylulose/3-keto-L-gulonate kinase n=1 Tax=Sedimentisphaera cyanobacteriorum TaxID=1940790 RepID=A0A1Q2HNS9_9BACT|nr:FGGY family carbohydrate kinase [Sedimentisphaera cyanobacteriorum]AQQ08981.1 L-xylulose/3-keto-L-gulonate kinase [Sedimentisphaera cyanobacteriorum]
MYLLGYDCGTSLIKATLLDAESGIQAASATAPAVEMQIRSLKPGWAEQSPEMWWDNLKNATAELLSNSQIDPSQIKAIGITYQMHGLVAVDKQLVPLRDSIIWCDSRSVDIGNRAFEGIGQKRCLQNLLNSPGNFTASKLKWVKDNEPEIYSRIYKAMLPGDYIAMKLTGEAYTTESGLSEMILWDFQKDRAAQSVLDYYGIDKELLPEALPTFSMQGKLSGSAAAELGLAAGTKVCYRAGDQPNNAFSLNVLRPGEIAATAGTSGVVYGVSDTPAYDRQSRVNSFVHVNHQHSRPRYGVLLCINGAGILNSWVKNNIASGIDYAQIDKYASEIPAGSEGLSIIPFGNGAERILGNSWPDGAIRGINFHVHSQSHIFRAAQEGIAFAMNYGLSIMKNMNLKPQTIKAGNANMFRSPVFCEAFSNVTGVTLELYNTDGSQGAARAAGIGLGIYKNFEEAFQGLECTKRIEPDQKLKQTYSEAYEKWIEILNKEE